MTVVDSSTWLKDYKAYKSLKEKKLAVDEQDERSVTDLLIDQVCTALIRRTLFFCFA